MSTIGTRLKELRASIKASQTELAQMAGSNQSSINRYEMDTAHVPARIMLWYADYFDVSLDYIFGRTDQPQGKLYGYQPRKIKEKLANEQEWSEFVEACFEPGSPMNIKLREMLIKMASEDNE